MSREQESKNILLQNIALLISPIAVSLSRRSTKTLIISSRLPPNARPSLTCRPKPVRPIFHSTQPMIQPRKISQRYQNCDCSASDFRWLLVVRLLAILALQCGSASTDVRCASEAIARMISGIVPTRWRQLGIADTDPGWILPVVTTLDIGAGAADHWCYRHYEAISKLSARAIRHAAL